LVFPSLYEGFGMPPIEMLACGGPVIASTAAALVETLGSHAHLIDPHDESGWRDGMERIITDDDWRQTLCHNAVVASRRFSWEKCAAQTLNAYHSLSTSRARAA